MLSILVLTNLIYGLSIKYVDHDFSERVLRLSNVMYICRLPHEAPVDHYSDSDDGDESLQTVVRLRESDKNNTNED